MCAWMKAFHTWWKTGHWTPKKEKNIRNKDTIMKCYKWRLNLKRERLRDSYFKIFPRFLAFKASLKSDRDPDQYQNSDGRNTQHFMKIWAKSIGNFLSYFVNTQTYKHQWKHNFIGGRNRRKTPLLLKAI